MKEAQSRKKRRSRDHPAADRVRQRAGEHSAELLRNHRPSATELNRFSVISLAALLAALPEPADKAAE
jgi:hypothetical protein